MSLRHEIKYNISYSDFITLQSKLKTVMKLDKNVNSNGVYIVRSLYFDNLYDSVLKDKLNGINNREKFRIRIYNGDTSFIKLEKKSKINGFSKKESITISIEECSRIINNDIYWMKDSDKELLRELYIKMSLGLLRPKMIVEYVRIAFIESASNVRITFDKDIKSSINDINILDFSVPLITKNNGVIIMEVKYDEYLPEYIQKLIKIKKSPIAYSKYGDNRLFN